MDITSPFSVTVRWTLRDALPADLGGSFLLQAYAEAIVPNPSHDFLLGEVEIPAGQVVADTGLETIIPVPQGVPTRGSFKLTAVITYLHQGQRTDMKAFLDGPVIELIG